VLQARAQLMELCIAGIQKIAQASHQSSDFGPS
jgi:hypothetical protein